MHELDQSAHDFQVHYTSDSESTYAHVHILSTGDDGLRLNFQWDGHDTWKYHDANLMPFPRGSRPSLMDTAPTASIVQNADASQHPDSKHHTNSDNDDYWNSYGAQADGDEDLPKKSAAYHRENSEMGEDAYWAQYASVQGLSDYFLLFSALPPINVHECRHSRFHYSIS